MERRRDDGPQGLLPDQGGSSALAEHDPVRLTHGGGYPELDVVTGAEYILQERRGILSRAFKGFLGGLLAGGRYSLGGYSRGFTPSPEQCADIAGLNHRNRESQGEYPIE